MIKIKLGSKIIKINTWQLALSLYILRESLLHFNLLIGLPTSLVGGGCIILMYICMAYSLIKKKVGISADTVLLILAVIALFVLTYMIHPNYATFFDGSYHTDSECDIMRTIFGPSSVLFFYWLIRECNNSDELWNTLTYISIVCIALDIVSMGAANVEYEMNYGYRLEFCAIILLSNYLAKQKTTRYLVLSLVAMFVAVLRGSRGCIIGYAVFTLLYEIVIEKKITIKKCLIFSGIAAGFLLVTSSVAMQALYNLFSKFGMSSRTLYYLATNGISDLSVSALNGRAHLYTTLTDVIKNSDLFTWYGAYGDRALLNGQYAYAHNLILEFLITFGKLFGGVLIILYIFNFIRNLVNKSYGDGISSRVLLIAFAAFSVCRLFISSSFWYEPYFWGSIAIMATMNQARSCRRVRLRVINKSKRVVS